MSEVHARFNLTSLQLVLKTHYEYLESFIKHLLLHCKHERV